MFAMRCGIALSYRSDMEHLFALLPGCAISIATKDAATAAAFQAYAVKDFDNNIVVDPAAFELRTNEQSALDVRCSLALDSDVPDSHITVSVHDSVVTLA